MATAVTEKSGGTQSATLDTEHTLLDTANSGVYQLFVDLTNLAGGVSPDFTTLRIYTKVRSGNDYKIIWLAIYQGGLTGANATAVSPAFAASIGYKATLEQTDGTGRDYIWAVKEIG